MLVARAVRYLFRGPSGDQQEKITEAVATNRTQLHA
jgi:hypothetical protein